MAKARRACGSISQRGRRTVCGRCTWNSILEGIDGTREMYHFAGANTSKYDAQTTTKELEDIEDIEVVLKSKGGGDT